MSEATEPIELAVIGAMLVDETRAEAISLAPEALFVSRAGKYLYAGVRRLYRDGYAVTPQSLATLIHMEGGMAQADADQFVASALTRASSKADLPFTVRALSGARVRLIAEQLASNLAKGASTMKAEQLLQQLAEVQREVGLLGSESAKGYSAVMTQLAGMERVKYLVPGMGPLDNILQFDEGAVCYVGGRSGGGKTAFMLNVAWNIAAAGHNVGIIEVEMRRKPIASRLAGIAGGLNSRSVMKGEISDGQREHLRHVAQQKADIIDRIRGIEPAEFHADMVKPTLERWRDEWGCEMVLIDYIQILTSGKSDETSHVQYCSRAITKASKDTGVPVMALSQLKKPHAGQTDVAATDFRGSSQLENDADTMVTLSKKDEFKPGQDTVEIYCEVVKNRNGAWAKDVLEYHLPTQRMAHSGMYVKPKAPDEAEQTPF